MKIFNIHKLLITCSLMLLPTFYFGQDKPKQHFSLFRPVPEEMMREMETDRPDVTEAPYTVDAGHIQYETDVIGFFQQASDAKKIKTVFINQGNLKIGLTNSTALQIGVETYAQQREQDLTNGMTKSTEGFGNISIRIKQNMIGNDSGNFALAVLPFVKLPTAEYENDQMVEGGLIVPMIYKLPGEWKLGFQVEIDRLKDLDQHAMHTELLQTLTISHPLSKKIEAIAETYYTYDFKAHQINNFVNAAV